MSSNLPAVALTDDPCASTTIPAEIIASHIQQARQKFNSFAIKKPDPTVQRGLQHGWMLPILLQLDDWLWQRWNYWYECCSNVGNLPDAPIPRIDFLTMPHAGTRKMVEASLNCIPNHGSWQTWGGWQFVTYFLDWLLYALGHKGQPELPPEPHGCSGVSNRLYQVFNLDAMLLWPYDYLGDLLAENSYGQKQGFYPTPHCICEMMTRMVFDEEKDHRRETMLDPCVGTGRFPLYASNYTLRLYAQDIDLTLCKATLVNAYMYAPWMARPIPWLDADLAQIGQEPVAPIGNDQSVTADANSMYDQSSVAAQLSDQMVGSAPPHAQDYLANTEHDATEQKIVAPILKRRKRQTSVDQGSLF